VADVGEWVSETSIISYADDTNTYASAPTKPEVRERLERAASEVLTFMQASKLSANPEKTKFVMFSRGAEDPLQVGEVTISESKEECLLGMTFAKSLSWKPHVDNLCSELMKRVGLLKRLKSHLPVRLLVSMIEPLFTSKLRYGLELLVNVEEGPEGVTVRKLDRMHKKAMRTTLGWKTTEGLGMKELLERTGQASVFQMALIATCGQAWKCARNWQGHPLTGGRLQSHLHSRNTRQGAQRLHPPQSLPGSLVHRMVEVWERMPLDIKEDTNLVSVKRKIKAWAKTQLV